MEKVARQMREILPVQGIWTVEDLAIYLGMKSHAVQEVLSEMGVKIYHFGREYKRKVFRLEDLSLPSPRTEKEPEDD